MLSIVAAEVIDERRYLSLKLDVERLNDIEPPPIGLPGYNPVDIGCNIVTN